MINRTTKLSSFCKPIAGYPCLFEEVLFNITWNCFGIISRLVRLIVVIDIIRAKDQLNDKTITKEIEAAAQKIMANGTKVSAFRLKESAPEYANLAKQVSVPSVLTIVKGLGMSAVSGEISETKLVQAFVAASRPSSCGPTGCEPTPANQGTGK